MAPQKYAVAPVQAEIDIFPNIVMLYTIFSQILS